MEIENSKGGEDMPKLREQRYKHADGSSVLNCYNVHITKAAAETAGLRGGDELIVRAEEGRIIIERADNAGEAR